MASDSNKNPFSPAAEKNLTRYLEVILIIYNRIKNDTGTYQLTQDTPDFTLHSERSDKERTLTSSDV